MSQNFAHVRVLERLHMKQIQQQPFMTKSKPKRSKAYYVYLLVIEYVLLSMYIVRYVHEI